MKNIAVKITSAAVAAGVAVGAVNANNLGSSKEVDLQSPSLIGPNAVTFDDFCSPAYEEAEDTGFVPMSLKNAKFNIDDYTIVAVKTYSDIASEFGTDPLDPITYDGATYWLNGDFVLVAPKVEKSNEETENEEDEDNEDEVESGNQDDVISLKLGDTVVRVAYTKEWSLVKLADGREGYIMSSHLSAEEISPESETEDTEDDDYYEEDNSSSSSSSYTDPDPEPYYEPDSEPEPEESSDPDWEEWDVDFTVYASTALNTRTGPGISYTLLTTLSMGSEIEVVAETDNGWYKSSDGYYIKASFTQDDEPYIPETVYYDDDDDYDEDWSDFASFVRSFIGCRYVYGGASPDGFDCSGFVMYCYEVYYGIYLPHGATSQSYRGYEVDPDDIQVGDIICFDKEGDGIMEHAGLYVGNDTYVHAQSSATGVVESNYSSAKWKIGTVRRVL